MKGGADSHELLAMTNEIASNLCAYGASKGVLLELMDHPSEGVPFRGLPTGPRDGGKSP